MKRSTLHLLIRDETGKEFVGDLGIGVNMDIVQKRGDGQMLAADIAMLLEDKMKRKLGTLLFEARDKCPTKQ